MNPLAQMAIAAVTAGLPTLTVLVSLLINNQRLSDFEKRNDQRFREVDQRFRDLTERMDQRFGEQRELLRSEMYRMEQVLVARLKHLEEG